MSGAAVGAELLHSADGTSVAQGSDRYATQRSAAQRSAAAAAKPIDAGRSSHSSCRATSKLDEGSIAQQVGEGQWPEGQDVRFKKKKVTDRAISTVS